MNKTYARHIQTPAIHRKMFSRHINPPIEDFGELVPIIFQACAHAYPVIKYLRNSSNEEIFYCDYKIRTTLIISINDSNRKKLYCYFLNWNLISVLFLKISNETIQTRNILYICTAFFVLNFLLSELSSTWYVVLIVLLLQLKLNYTINIIKLDSGVRMYYQRNSFSSFICIYLFFL